MRNLVLTLHIFWPGENSLIDFFWVKKKLFLATFSSTKRKYFKHAYCLCKNLVIFQIPTVIRFWVTKIRKLILLKTGDFRKLMKLFISSLSSLSWFQRQSQNMLQRKNIFYFLHFKFWGWVGLLLNLCCLFIVLNVYLFGFSTSVGFTLCIAIVANYLLYRPFEHNYCCIENWEIVKIICYYLSLIRFVNCRCTYPSFMTL